MKAIVGLGNPGKKYETTRHNVGFLVIDELAKHLNIISYQKKFNAHYALVEYQGEKTILIKPQTYMNLSGEAVFSFLNYYKIDIKDVLVISDDVDLPVGMVRIRPFGGAGGQKGLANIIDRVQSNQFPRMRIGIGKHEHMDTADYVLGKFSQSDIPHIIKAVNLAKEASLLFIRENIEATMNTYNNQQTHEEHT